MEWAIAGLERKFEPFCHDALLLLVLAQAGAIYDDDFPDLLEFFNRTPAQQAAARRRVVKDCQFDDLDDVTLREVADAFPPYSELWGM